MKTDITEKEVMTLPRASLKINKCNSLAKLMKHTLKNS